MKKKDTKQELSFEAALKKLEDMVAKIENNEVSLDKAISIYQEGMELAQQCSKELEEATKKIQVLIAKDGKLTKEEFNP